MPCYVSNHFKLSFVTEVDLSTNLILNIIMAAQVFTRLGQLGAGLALAGGVVNQALFNVDGGHRAVIFDR